MLTIGERNVQTQNWGIYECSIDVATMSIVRFLHNESNFLECLITHSNNDLQMFYEHSLYPMTTLVPA